MDAHATALDAALVRLRCPVCGDLLRRDERVVSCPAGHSFDLARQGYLNLAVGKHAGTADSAAMVAARADFLARGHYRPIADALAEAVGDARFVADLAGGTGYYLAIVLEMTRGYGVCLDLSTAALRRAAHAHPRVAAVGADAWRPLPLGDGTADAVLSVFGPRDPGQIERVLAPSGVLVTVSPAADHLAELIGPLAMIGIAPDKRERSAASFARFARSEVTSVRRTVRMSRDDAFSAAAMGPSAWHVPAAELRDRADRLDEWTDVTIAVEVTSYRPQSSD